MRSTLISIVALLAGASALNLGLGLQASLLGVRAHIEGFPVLATGLIMASYYAGFILGSLWCPALVRRVGHIRTFAVLASVASATAVCHASFVTPAWWVVFRAATGVCLAGLSMVAESWLNHRADNANRGSLLAMYMTCLLGGTAAGQLLLNVASPAGYNLFILVSVVLSLSLVPVALTKTPAPGAIERRAMPLRQLFRSAPLGVMGCLSSGILTGAFWSLGAVYARDIGLDTLGISLFMTFLILGGALLQWPLGRISDLTDRRTVIAVQCFLLALGGALMGFDKVLAGSALLVFIALFGGLLLPLYATTVAHVNDYLEPEFFVPASATLLLAYGVGATVGPLAASALMALAGPGGIFLLTMIVGLTMGTYALYRITRRAAAEGPGRFVVVPRTTPVAYELDPRAPQAQSGN